MTIPMMEGMRVSHETIYSWFYVLPKGELKAQLLQGLRRHRTRLVARARIPSKHVQITEMVSIDDRSDEMAERKLPATGKVI
jgi:transposase, IS30 family